MRKTVLFIAALLFMAVPAMAVTPININAVDEGGGVVRIGYDATGHGQLPRAFALDITVSAGVITDINNYHVGVSTQASKGYGIFPGSIDINATTYVVDNNGTPVGDPCAFPGTLPGLDTNGVTIEMGSLYVGGPNAPPVSGTLCKVTVSASCNLTVTGNVARGKVVNEDANEASTNLPITIPVTIGCTVPNVVHMTEAAAITAITTTAGFPAPTVVYGNGGAEPIGQVYSQNPVYTGNPIDCSTIITINVSSQCMKSATTPASIRTDWVTWGKPRCWCYERNCRGDSDGVQAGVIWVGPVDLNLLKATYMKSVAVLQTIPNGICADFDHLPTGVIRVGPADLNTIKAYYMKPVASVPVCVQSPNYYFWCTPPATCPANF
jgi:hypothetical protein